MKENKSSLNMDKTTQEPLTEQADLTVTDETHDDTVVDSNISSSSIISRAFHLKPNVSSCTNRIFNNPL